MFRTFHNILQLPIILSKISYNLRKQKRYLHKNFDSIINTAFADNDGTLQEKDSQKIYQYYGLAVPAILGEAMCALRKTPMTNNERWVCTCLGSITGLFDDFLDEMSLPEDQIKKLVLVPEKVKAKTSAEKLFLNFYLSALANAAHPDIIKNQLMKVHYAQIASIEQTKSEVTNKRILEITREKGGESVVFYQTALAHHPDKVEKKAMFLLGAAMQLENDIFDIYKDNYNNINTIATKTKKIADLRKLYKNEIDNFISALSKTKYSSKQKMYFLNIIMPVLNRGWVCLDAYQHLELQNNNNFNLNTFNRRQLICDMEKPINFLKTAHYQIHNNY